MPSRLTSTDPMMVLPRRFLDLVRLRDSSSSAFLAAEVDKAVGHIDLVDGGSFAACGETECGQIAELLLECVELLAERVSLGRDRGHRVWWWRRRHPCVRHQRGLGRCGLRRFGHRPCDGRVTHEL